MLAASERLCLSLRPQQHNRSASSRYSTQKESGTYCRSWAYDAFPRNLEPLQSGRTQPLAPHRPCLLLIACDVTPRHVMSRHIHHTASLHAILPQVMAIVVNRARYLPVKSTSDLFLVQSNLYGVRHGSLVMSAERPDGSTPLIKLGREFTSVEDYLRRIPHGVPTITQLDHLTVAGDVMFGENVTLKVRL